MPGASFFEMENYKHARDKMHNKSSLKVLFNEGDMDWIMSMIFYCEDADTKPLLYFSAVAGAAFGSIHCAAWNFDFPSHVEQIMWRTASLTLVGVCLSIFFGGPIIAFSVLEGRVGSGQSIFSPTTDLAWSAFLQAHRPLTRPLHDPLGRAKVGQVGVRPGSGL